MVTCIAIVGATMQAGEVGGRTFRSTRDLRVANENPQAMAKSAKALRSALFQVAQATEFDHAHVWYLSHVG